MIVHYYTTESLKVVFNWINSQDCDALYVGNTSVMVTSGTA